MDSKSSVKSKGGRKYKAPKGKVTNLGWLHQPQASKVFKTGYSVGDLSTGTAGTLSTCISCSMSSNMTEYSSLQSEYTECRLLKCVLELAPVNPMTVTGKWESKITVGWNPIFNYTTFTNPTSFSEVINLDMSRPILTSSLRVTMVPGVPKNLVTNSIANANPAPNTGDCGAWVVYGPGLTASTAYFSAFVYGYFVLSGRA